MTILLENYGYYKPTIKATTKRNHYFELGLDIKPFQSYDFMNLEIFGRYLEVPKSISGYSGVEFNRNNFSLLILR
jgi:hypothetical protein